MKPPFRYPTPERPRDAGLVNSWYFLVPMGLICLGMLLARAWGYVS